MNSFKTSHYKAKLAANLGNFVEWYDFTIFAYFATIIAHKFFPSSNHSLSLIATFAAYASGFFMRPLGAIVCSHIGDKKGKAGVLKALIFLISVPTILTGFLPTYQTAGIIAPILITLFRMMQGFCVGPQFSGSILYVAESSSDKSRGFNVGVVWAVSTFGCSAGVIACIVTLKLFPHAAWNWRVPFLLGFIPLVIAPFLKRHLVNLPRATTQIRARFPLAYALKHYALPIFSIMLSSMIGYVSFFTLLVYIPIPLEDANYAV